jgi:hypothetical protein
MALSVLVLAQTTALRVGSFNIRIGHPSLPTINQLLISQPSYQSIIDKTLN